MGAGRFGRLVVLPALLMAATSLAAQWAPCEPRGAGARPEQCTMVAVPLDHERADGPRIQIAVRRVPAAAREARQLWFVDGGPGDAGTASLGRVARIFAADSDLAIYTFDHRGVGGSSPLACPEQQKAGGPDGTDLAPGEWAPCIVHLRSTRADLPFISVGQAAQDLALLVDGFRRPEAATTVWGVSYGTFLVWEYLRIARHHPDAVIADGIVPPDWSFAEFDAGLDAAGRRWLAECVGEPDCAARLGPDPVAFTRDAAGGLGEGPCRELGLTPSMYRLILGNLLMSGEPARRLIPVVAYRVHRCNGWDRRAVSSLVENLFESGEVGEKASHNPIAQRHLALSALWRESDPGADRLEQALDSVVMTTGVSASFAKTWKSWPLAPGPGSRELPDFGGPMLLLHGDHDPTMPVARLTDLRDRYRRGGQRFLVVPWAGHVTINENPCVRSIYRAFLAAPLMAPDTACLRDLRRPPMVPDAALATRVLGTDDVWGDRWPGWLYTALMTGLYLGGPGAVGVGVWLLWRQRRRRATP